MAKLGIKHFRRSFPRKRPVFTSIILGVGIFLLAAGIMQFANKNNSSQAPNDPLIHQAAVEASSTTTETTGLLSGQNNATLPTAKTVTDEKNVASYDPTAGLDTDETTETDQTANTQEVTATTEKMITPADKPSTTTTTTGTGTNTTSSTIDWESVTESLPTIVLPPDIIQTSTTDAPIVAPRLSNRICWSQSEIDGADGSYEAKNIFLIVRNGLFAEAGNQCSRFFDRWDPTTPAYSYYGTCEGQPDICGMNGAVSVGLSEVEEENPFCITTHLNKETDEVEYHTSAHLGCTVEKDVTEEREKTP